MRVSYQAVLLERCLVVENATGSMLADAVRCDIMGILICWQEKGVLSNQSLVPAHDPKLIHRHRQDYCDRLKCDESVS
jgi:hypothetical protein